MDIIYSYFYPNYKEYIVINNHTHPLIMIINNNRYEFYVNEQYKIKFNVDEKVSVICKTCHFKRKQYLERVNTPDESNNPPSFIAIDVSTVDVPTVDA